MNILRVAMIIGSFGFFTDAFSSEVLITENAPIKQSLSVNLSEDEYAAFSLKPENKSILENHNVSNYRDYEKYLYNYYSEKCSGKPPFRNPESYHRCKRRSTEEFIVDVDRVNSYLEHIFYHLGG